MNIPQPYEPLSILLLIDSVKLTRVWRVECFSRKPNCRGCNKEFISMNLYSLLCISFSMILLKIDNKDIGREFVGSSVEPFLCKGMTFASFKSSGNMPVEKDPLTMIHNGSAMRLLRIFNRLIGMLKGPAALPFLRELIMSTISSVVTGDTKKRRISVGMEIIRG